MDLNGDGLVNMGDLSVALYLLVSVVVSGLVVSFRQQIWGWIWRAVKKIAGATPAPTAQETQSQQADADLKVAQLTLFWQTMYRRMQDELRQLQHESEKDKADFEKRLNAMQHDLANMDQKFKLSEQRYQRLVRAVRMQPDGGAATFQTEQDLAANEKKEREQ